MQQTPNQQKLPQGQQQLDNPITKISFQANPNGYGNVNHIPLFNQNPNQQGQNPYYNMQGFNQYYPQGNNDMNPNMNEVNNVQRDLNLQYHNPNVNLNSSDCNQPNNPQNPQYVQGQAGNINNDQQNDQQLSSDRNPPFGGDNNNNHINFNPNKPNNNHNDNNYNFVHYAKQGDYQKPLYYEFKKTPIHRNEPITTNKIQAKNVEKDQQNLKKESWDYQFIEVEFIEKIKIPVPTFIDLQLVEKYQHLSKQINDKYQEFMNSSSLSSEIKNKQKLEFAKINFDTFNKYKNQMLPQEKKQNNKIFGERINLNQENPNPKRERGKKKKDPKLNNDNNNNNNNNDNNNNPKAIKQKDKDHPFIWEIFSRQNPFQKQLDNQNQKQQQAPKKSKLDLLLDQRRKEFQKTHDIMEEVDNESNCVAINYQYDFLDDYQKGPENPNSKLLTMFEYIQDNYLTTNQSLLKENLQKQELKKGDKQSKFKQNYFEHDFETHPDINKLQYYEIKLSKVTTKTDFSGFIMEQTRQFKIPQNQLLKTVIYAILKQKLSEVTRDASTRFILNQLKRISPKTKTLENKLLRLIYLAFYTAALLAVSDREYNDTAKQLIGELFKYQIVLDLFFKRAIDQVTHECKDKSKLEIILEQENKEYKKHDLLINQFVNIYKVNIILFDKSNKYERNCFLKSEDISTLYVFSKQNKSDKNISVAVTFDITEEFNSWFSQKFQSEKQQGEPVKKY